MRAPTSLATTQASGARSAGDQLDVWDGQQKGTDDGTFSNYDDQYFSLCINARKDVSSSNTMLNCLE
ncbi:hypothetical protein WN51_06868 [Melipona quadrifasciata]|uniref:Uncharacterized protein n=1 Tax=Melipona quadrifasciata TaxID=166423 RepID=A0A0N0BCK5_9HYME|nr:hypothetical protein WN51_06868 [Melipona quadrifasciata]